MFKYSNRDACYALALWPVQPNSGYTEKLYTTAMPRLKHPLRVDAQSLDKSRTLVQKPTTSDKCFPNQRKKVSINCRIPGIKPGRYTQPLSGFNECQLSITLLISEPHTFD